MAITSYTKDTDAISFVEDGVTRKVSVTGSDVILSLAIQSMDQIIYMHRRQSDGKLVIGYFDTSGDKQEVALNEMGGGGGPTITVAASDSSASSIARADYACDGTADNVQIQAAIDAAEGDIYLHEGIYSIAATVNVKTGRHLILAHNATIKPATDIDMLQMYYDSRISGGVLDVSDLGVGNFTASCILVEAPDPGGTNFGTNYTNDTFGVSHIKIKGVEGGSTFGGKGIYLHATDTASSKILHMLFDDIRILGAFSYGLHLVCSTASGAHSQIRVNDFNKILIHNCEQGVILEAASSNGYGPDLNNFSNIFVQGLGSSNLRAYEITGLLNKFKNCSSDTINGGNALVLGTGSWACSFEGNVDGVTDNGKDNVTQAKFPRPITPIQNPLGSSGFDADFIIPFQQGRISESMVAIDISHHNRHGTFTNDPTRGTITETGWVKAVFDDTDHLVVPDMQMTGDRTVIVAFAPAYDYDDDTDHKIWIWEHDVANKLWLRKEVGNTINALRYAASGEASVSVSLPFSSGDQIIAVVTVDSSTGTVALYWNGVFMGSDTDAGTMATDVEDVYLGIYANAVNDPAPGDYYFFACLPRKLNEAEVAEVTERIADVIGLSHTRTTGYPHKVLCPTALDLSGGATDIEVYHAVKAGYLTGYTILYTEASSADAGVNIQVGRYQDGVALDGDYFDVSTSEVSKSLGYAKHFVISDLTQHRIAVGDIVTAGHAGSKTGTGEVEITLEVTED